LSNASAPEYEEYILKALMLPIMYEALLDAQEWMLLNGKKMKSVDDAVDRYRETYEKPSGDTS